VGFAGLSLLCLNHPEESRFDQAPDKDGLIHQHKDIERIAVFSDRVRDRSKIERKNSA